MKLIGELKEKVEAAESRDEAGRSRMQASSSPTTSSTASREAYAMIFSQSVTMGRPAANPSKCPPL